MISKLEKSWVKLTQNLQNKSSFSDAEIRAIEFLINQMDGIAQSFSDQEEIHDL